MQNESRMKVVKLFKFVDVLRLADFKQNCDRTGFDK